MWWAHGCLHSSIARISSTIWPVWTSTPPAPAFQQLWSWDLLVLRNLPCHWHQWPGLNPFLWVRQLHAKWMFLKKKYTVNVKGRSSVNIAHIRFHNSFSSQTEPCVPHVAQIMWLIRRSNCCCVMRLFNIHLKWHQEQLGFIKVKNVLWTKFTREVFIDLIHLQDNVIRDASFSQENIQLARHTTSNRVDSKPVISDGRITYISGHQIGLHYKPPTQWHYMYYD